MEICTARQAFEAGKKRYFTGEPCAAGHLAERYVSNGGCIECLNLRNAKKAAADPGYAYAKTKEWRAKNHDLVAAQAQRYRQKHPENIRAIQSKYRVTHLEEIRTRDKENKRRLRQAYPEAERARQKRWAEKRDLARELDAGREKPPHCEVCGDTNTRIVFDHDHATGKFRGWLCDRCNKTLGHVKDTPDLLRKLADYLEVK
jgi:hypothetical protein